MHLGIGHRGGCLVRGQPPPPGQDHLPPGQDHLPPGQDHPFWTGPPPSGQNHLPPGTGPPPSPPPVYGQRSTTPPLPQWAGGTHSTGMHSYYDMDSVTERKLKNDWKSGKTNNFMLIPYDLQINNSVFLSTIQTTFRKLKI